MRKVSLLVLMACFTVGATALPFLKTKVKINGEKITLEDGIYAKIETTLGDILIEFNTDLAPMTSANFIMLAEGKMPEADAKFKDVPYFNGLLFHRVIPGFMIQGGDPEGNGQGGPGYQFPNEINEELVHNKGVISMANAGPNTNGSQFFITVEETRQLDGGYSVFGKVLSGQFVADSISNVKRNNRDKPETDVVMNTVTIIRVGKTYKNWDAMAAFTKGKADFEIKQKEEQARQLEEARIAKEKADALAAEFAKKYPNAKTTPSGLMYVLEDVGSGEKPENGMNVGVHYAGYFADGKLFDTSIKSIAEQTGTYNPQREPYGPMPMTYGPNAQMIPGFKEGVALLNVGGKAKLIIPPGLAYGDRGAGGVIPPHSWLIFDIELVEIIK